MEYVDTDKVSIRKISKRVAKRIIVDNHYTHAWTSCRYALGIYYEGDGDSFFGGEELIGCIVYGHPVGASAADSISPELGKENVLELKRLWIADGYGKNIESYSISQSFKWLRENAPYVKALISYSDSEQDHLGTIYQATNWLYVGTSKEIQLMDNYRISLQENPYDWIHSRTSFSRWGSTNLEHLRREIGKEGYSEFWRMKEPFKFRYIYILETNKKKKKKFLNDLKHKPRPYPKESDKEEIEIEHYTTHEAESDGYW